LLCSLGDWLNNISDLLTDARFDDIDIDADGDADTLFCFYTRILLAVSEILEDFVMVHKQVTDIKKKSEAGDDFAKGAFHPRELQALSDYINSVTKHKTERSNLHVNNHHQKKEFEDFGTTYHDNQVSLKDLAWDSMNKDTTILIPTLGYLIDMVIRLNQRFDELMRTSAGYMQTTLMHFIPATISGRREKKHLRQQHNSQD
jgi:uncharacterized metal-binding protein